MRGLQFFSSRGQQSAAASRTFTTASTQHMLLPTSEPEQDDWRPAYLINSRTHLDGSAIRTSRRLETRSERRAISDAHWVVLSVMYKGGLVPRR